MKRQLSNLLVLLGAANIFTSCNIEKVKISRTEKIFYQKLAEDCHCKVSYHHNYGLVKGLSNKDSYGFSLDLTQTKNYENVRYNKNDDWCYKDSLFLIKKAELIAKGFLEVSEYAKYYNTIRIYFNSYVNVGEREVLDNEMCARQVIFYLDKQETVFKTRVLQ